MGCSSVVNEDDWIVVTSKARLIDAPPITARVPICVKCLKFNRTKVLISILLFAIMVLILYKPFLYMADLRIMGRGILLVGFFLFSATPMIIYNMIYAEPVRHDLVVDDVILTVNCEITALEIIKINNGNVQNAR